MLPSPRLAVSEQFKVTTNTKVHREVKSGMSLNHVNRVCRDRYY